MLAKDIYSNAEVTFWDAVIMILSGLRWLKSYRRKLLAFMCQVIAWCSIGFLIGLVAGYVTF